MYRVKVLFGAPKASHESTETYLVAESDEQVADWINKEKCYGNWFEEDEPGGYEVDGNEVSFRDYVLANCGDLEDEAGWEDAHYGVKKWGWEVVGRFDEDGMLTSSQMDDESLLEVLGIVKGVA